MGISLFEPRNQFFLKPNGQSRVQNCYILEFIEVLVALNGGRFVLLGLDLVVQPRFHLHNQVHIFGEVLLRDDPVWQETLISCCGRDLSFNVTFHL